MISSFSNVKWLFFIVILLNISVGQAADREIAEDTRTTGSQKESVEVMTRISRLENDIGEMKILFKRLQNSQALLKDTLLSRFQGIDTLLAGAQATQFILNVKIDSLASRTDRGIVKLQNSFRKNLTIAGGVFIIIIVGFLLGVMKIRRKTRLSQSRSEDRRNSSTKLGALQEDQFRPDETPKGPTEKPQEEADLDHSLAIRLGEEIYRMRLMISNVDEDSKGVNALKNAISRLEDDLSTRGYAIKDLTGQTYVEEMLTIVKGWEPKDEIAPGEQRIVRMLKPQILYKDVAISPGEIIVGISVSDSIHSDRRD